MFNPNDINTIEQIFAPQEGEVFLNAAIFTYSLDVESLIAFALVAYGFNPAEKEREAVNLYVVLNKFRKAVKVICNPGSVKLAGNARHVYNQIVGDMVNYPNLAKRQSFHPKLIIAKYKRLDDKGEPCFYRLLISSRNLTASDCWETGIVLASKRKGHAGAIKGKELLAYIRSQMGTSSWLKDLAQFGFSPLGGNHPVKIITSATDFIKEKNRILNADQAIVVSPFLDGFINEIKKREGLVVISRSESLKVLKQSNVKAVQFPLAYETNFEESGDLHAKLYFIKDGDTCYAYIGSANATNRGWGRNKECLIRIGSATRLFREFENNFIYAGKEGSLSPWLEEYHKEKGKDKERERREGLETVACALLNPTYKLKIEDGLVDVTIKYSKAEINIILPYAPVAKCGLVIGRFGGNGFVLKGIPITEYARFVEISFQFEGKRESLTLLSKDLGNKEEERLQAIKDKLSTAFSEKDYLYLLAAFVHAGTNWGRQGGGRGWGKGLKNNLRFHFDDVIKAEAYDEDAPFLTDILKQITKYLAKTAKKNDFKIFKGLLEAKIERLKNGNA